MGGRLCGDRVAGGIYLVVETGARGHPVEEFLLDPPHILPTAALGITPIGQKLVERGDTAFVFDQVGEKFYPNVADMIEEIRVMGVSRRVSRTFDFGKLKAGRAMLVLLHPRAMIRNWREYAFWEPEGARACPQLVGFLHCGRPPKADHHATPQTEFCGRFWYQDIEGGEPVVGRAVNRVVPSGEYRGFSRPEGVFPQYELAAFARFPIHRIEMVRKRGGADAEYEEALAAARRADLPVEEVDA